MFRVASICVVMMLGSCSEPPSAPVSPELASELETADEALRMRAERAALARLYAPHLTREDFAVLTDAEYRIGGAALSSPMMTPFPEESGEHFAGRRVYSENMPDDVMGERIWVAAVPKEGETVTLEEIIAFLKSKEIANFKLPEQLILVEALPRNPLNKVLRWRLVEMAKEKQA